MKKSILVKTDMGEIQCDYFASELIEGAERINKSLVRMRQLLEATYPREHLGKIEYELYTYESEEINAFSVEKDGCYVIAFSTAMFLQFYKRLKNLFLVKEICEWFETEPTEAEYCVNAVYDYMIWFVTFHEFFHVINGHCKYLSERGLFYAEQSREQVSDDNLLFQTLESDADYSAVTACVQFIFVQAKNSGAFDDSVDEDKRRLLIKVAEAEVIYLGFAVYHTFLLFSCAQKEKMTDCVNTMLRYDHPYASIRMAYSFMAITYQLGYFLKMDEIVILLRKIDEIFIAYDRIYYAEESFEKSLVSLAFTEKGVQHIMLLHNGWNNLVEDLRKHAHINLERKEELDQLNYWVNDDGTMMKV